MRVHACGHVGVHPQLFQTLGDGAGNQRGRQISIGAQQGVGAGVGHGPFATAPIGAVAFHFVELAQHARAHIGAPVVQLFLELVFNDLALFFHYQDFLQASRKFARELGFERPHHRHLVQANADALAGGVVQPQVQQRLARIVKGLTAGHQAKAIMGALNHVVVKTVGADVGQRGVPLGIEQAGFLVERGVRPADVHAAGGHGKVGGDLDAHALRIHIHGGARLDNFLDGFHTRPHARKTAHSNAVQAQVEHVLHAGRKKQGRATGLEDVVTLVRGCGAFGQVVIPGHGQHAAPGRGSGHIGVLEHVRAAVHARALAVPDAKHAVIFIDPRRRKAQLLRAPQGGGGQFFVDAGLKNDMVRFQMRFGLLQRLVVRAQG